VGQRSAASHVLGVQAGVDAGPVRLDQRVVGGLSRVGERFGQLSSVSAITVSASGPRVGLTRILLRSPAVK